MSASGKADEEREVRLPVDAAWLAGLKEGDEVVRMLAGSVPMKMRVTSRDEQSIKCNELWSFHPKTGAEVDEALGWDGLTTTGSFLRPPYQT